MEKFVEKLLKIQFRAIPINPVVEFFSWMINSKTRTFKRIDLFLKDQLDEIKTSDELYRLAQNLRGKNPDETIYKDRLFI